MVQEQSLSVSKDIKVCSTGRQNMALQNLTKCDHKAERHGIFIKDILKKMFGVNVFDSVIEVKLLNQEDQGSNEASKEEGLYMFYVKPDECFCPIYVGYTDSSFYGRFKNHAQTGVVKKFFEGPINKKDKKPLQVSVGDKEVACHSKYKLYVIQLPCSGTKAILLEKLFLEAFDFALNTEDNGPARATLELPGQGTPIWNSKLKFKGAWEKMESELQEIIKSVGGAL